MTDALLISFLVVSVVMLIGIFIFRKNPFMIGLVCIAYIIFIMYFLLPMSAAETGTNGAAAFNTAIQDAACREAHQCLNKT